MDLSGLGTALWLVFGVLAVIGFANLIDYGLRSMAEHKAERAESARFQKWKLPAPKRPEEPVGDEHLWHF